MIRKEGNVFVLRSKLSNKTLGTHKTKKAAQAQEKAILASKAKQSAARRK